MVGHTDNDKTYYAIALPKTDKYINQCRKLSDFIRRKLRLHIILVDEKGKVSIIYPEDSIKD